MGPLLAYVLPRNYTITEVKLKSPTGSGGFKRLFERSVFALNYLYVSTLLRILPVGYPQPMPRTRRPSMNGAASSGDARKQLATTRQQRYQLHRQGRC